METHFVAAMITLQSVPVLTFGFDSVKSCAASTPTPISGQNSNYSAYQALALQVLNLRKYSENKIQNELK